MALPLSCRRTYPASFPLGVAFLAIGLGEQPAFLGLGLVFLMQGLVASRSLWGRR